VPDPATGERLAVVVVPRSEDVPDLVADPQRAYDAVVAHLLGHGVATRKLPEQVVVRVAPLPRTASGKVARPQLEGETATWPSGLAPRLRS
jgi:acyl-CoA synthetase (AMP-forming)/AMP-acid ligase II